MHTSKHEPRRNSTTTPTEKWLQASYDRAAADYDARFLAAQLTKYRTMLDAAPDMLATRLKHGHALDLGSGTGLLRECIRARDWDLGHWTAIDLSGGMLTKARERGALAVRANARCLPFADGSFDVVFAFTVFGLINRRYDAEILAETARVARASGLLVLTMLAASHDAGWPALMRSAGLHPVAVLPSGQDVGYICVRRTV